MSNILKTKQNMQKLVENLSKLKDMQVYDSQANFVLLKLNNQQVSNVCNKLKDSKILVKAFINNPRLANFLRITVDTESANIILCEQLKKIIK